MQKVILLFLSLLFSINNIFSQQKVVQYIDLYPNIFANFDTPIGIAILPFTNKGFQVNLDTKFYKELTSALGKKSSFIISFYKNLDEIKNSWEINSWDPKNNRLLKTLESELDIKLIVYAVANDSDDNSFELKIVNTESGKEEFSGKYFPSSNSNIINDAVRLFTENKIAVYKISENKDNENKDNENKDNENKDSENKEKENNFNQIDAQEAYNLKYNFEKGKNYLYTSDFNSKLTQEVMGKETKFDNNVHSIIRFSVEDVAGNGDADIITSMDSAIVNSNIQGKNTTISLKDIIGKKSECIVSAFGEMKSFTQIDNVSANNTMMSISQQLKRYFVKFSGQEIKIGEPWTNTDIDTMSAVGGTIINTSNYVCTLAAKEIKLGRDCFKVPFTVDIKIKGKENTQGMDLSIEGTGKAGGTMYIDQKSGVLIYSESNTDSDMTIAVSGQQNMVIPVTQSMKTTQSLISE